MEWTKIKAQHFLYTDLTMVERGALSTALLVTAHLERIPTDTEIYRHVPSATYLRLCSKLPTPMLHVMRKVLEDVERVKRRREVSGQTSQRYRDSQQSDTSPSSSRDASEKRREERRRVSKGKHKKFKQPTLKEIKEYISSRGSGVDPNKFLDFYSSKGWMVGKNKMVDWKACVRTWERGTEVKKCPPKL